MGSRSKLSENFLSALEQAWERNGDLVLDKLAVERPLEFVELVNKIADPSSEREANHNRAVFGLGDVLAAIVARSSAGALPNGPIRVIDARPEPTGRDEAVDSGPLPGSRE